ncbi:hypothetical protein ACFS6H_18050 [Terrimonas rubra]|uniref:Phage abortive infection protein n=1 Tax=Terrimonas rubra TaxID=1035890 RepID=A0ABW6AA35_9BACT
MKKLIVGLKYLSITLATLSLFFVIYSLTTLLWFDTSISFVKSVDNIYKAVATYSELYKFTFIVCAFWVTLRQLEISQSNYNTTLGQVKFVQEDILDKRKKDEKNETLSQCNFFLNDLQISFKELIETEVVSGMPLDWSLLKTLTNSSLKEKCPQLHEKMNAIERPKKNQILITLYKLEAFSSLFIHGNLDKKLGQDIIGYTYSKQVGFLLGLISYFREDTTTAFGLNTIKLFYEWRTDKDEL